MYDPARDVWNEVKQDKVGGRQEEEQHAEIAGKGQEEDVPAATAGAIAGLVALSSSVIGHHHHHHHHHNDDKHNVGGGIINEKDNVTVDSTHEAKQQNDTASKNLMGEEIEVTRKQLPTSSSDHPGRNDNTEASIENRQSAYGDDKPVETSELKEEKEKEKRDFKRDHDTAEPKSEESKNEAVQPPPKKLKRPSRRGDKNQQEQRAQELRANLDKKKESDAVREHYNQRPELGVESRELSPILALRHFNNYIKSVLIQNEGLRHAVVLDVGCGKGGDLLKWDKSRCKGWIGIDIADVSVQQARDRYNNLRKQEFWADFCVGDAFRQSVEDIVHPDAFPVDVVSIQFGMHYAWEEEELARGFLSNVSRALRAGGRFIGTIPDSEEILRRVKNLPEGVKEFGNSVYRVQFDELPPPTTQELTSDYGNKYHFFLEDAVDVPEYLVPFQSFVKLAAEYDLELVYERPFLDMFDDIMNDPRAYQQQRLASRIKVFKSDGTLGIEGEQREASGFYKAFAFERK